MDAVQRRIEAGRGFPDAAACIGPSHNSRHRAARNEGIELTVVEWIDFDERRKIQRSVARRRAGQAESAQACGRGGRNRGSMRIDVRLQDPSRSLR